jgi:hypothetical protein
MFARKIAAPFAALILLVATAISASPVEMVKRDPIRCKPWDGDVNTLHFTPLDQGSGLSKYVYSLPTGQSAWYSPQDNKVTLVQREEDVTWTAFQVTVVNALKKPISKTQVVQIDGTKGAKDCSIAMPAMASYGGTSLEIKVFSLF